MKKLIMTFALLLCAACFAESRVLIYDIQMSFKRIDTKKVSTRDEYNREISCKLDSARVASDKLSGYLVIQACEECYGNMENSVDENTCVAYLVRKNDSGKHIYRSVGNAEIFVFGTKSGIILQGPYAGEMMNAHKLTDAGLKLQLPLEFDLINGIGFLGPRSFTVTDLKPTVIDGRGFGKVSRTKVSATEDCWSQDSYCMMLKQATGAWIVDYFMTGACSDFLFDLCSAPNHDNETHAYGTYTVKLNTSLTKKVMTWADAEALIFSKLKKSGCYGTNDEFTEAEGLYKAATWGPVSE